MRRIILMVAMGIAAGAMYAQDCSELFISEYLEGSGNNKGIEIYNPTEEVINLGSYWLSRLSNGNTTIENGDGYSTQLEGFIQPYGTHLIVNGQTEDLTLPNGGTSPASDPSLRAMAQQMDGGYPAPTYMNGNDAIALFKDPVGNGDVADFVLIDLFGIIGGGMTSDDVGWASITEQWIYRNIFEDDEIVGQDSFYVTNYIIPGDYYFLDWWIWSRDHALVRKPNVTKGVTNETMPQIEFNVTLEWDTVPGGADQWDSLNAHYCICEFETDIEEAEVIRSFNMFPNPSGSFINISYDDGIDQVTIHDMSGKLVFRSGDLSGIRQEEFSIDQLSDGMYMLRVRSGDRLLSRKLIKN